MELRAYFKHMPSSLPLYAYAQTKLADRIDKYALGLTDLQVTFASEGNAHTVHCHVNGNGRYALAVESQDEISMYAAVDKLADKLEECLRRRKDRLSEHSGSAPLPLDDSLAEA